MEKFYKTWIGKNDLDADQSLIQLSKCLDLVAKSPFKDELIRLQNFETIKDEYVPLKGLRKIVSSIIDRDEQFQKIDIISHLSDVKYIPTDEDRQIVLHFEKVENYTETDLQAETIYSAKGDYFDNFFKLERFANFCISHGHTDLLQQNILQLNQRYKDDEELKRSFRLLLDKENKYYVRAITSINKYFDYNIRFSLFVTIVALHKLQKNKSISFEIDLCEYDESSIRIFFERVGHTVIPGVGKMTFMLEMSNDEIKREAFRFSCLVSLTTNTRDREVSIYLKPKRMKTELISIKHSYKPDTVIGRTSRLDEFIKLAEEEMKQDIVDFSKVDNADKLRYTLLRKIERSREPKLAENSALKNELKQTLSQRIERIADLLDMMDKLDKIVTDLELKEFLRYTFYEVLSKSK